MSKRLSNLRKTIYNVVVKAEFTAGEASRLAGFKKPWMLGHLEREGIFVREHCDDRRHGRARKYTFADVIILRSINRMLELGARPARIKKVIANLAELAGMPKSQRAALKLVQRAGTCLFVTEKEAFFTSSREEVIDLASRGATCLQFYDRRGTITKSRSEYDRLIPEAKIPKLEEGRAHPQ